MCDSTGALAAFGLGAQVFGGINAAAGAASAARAQQFAGEYNARAADLEASDALARGAQAEQAVRGRTARLKGSQRAALAANGQDLGAGSALAILTDTDVQGEADALQADANGRKEAAAARMRAAGYRAGAAGVSPGLAFGTSLIGSATNVARSWYTYRERSRNSGGG